MNPFLLYSLAFSLVIFSACNKNTDSIKSTQSGVMAFNLIPDKVSVGFLVSNYNLTNASLSYPNYTGNYLSVNSGQGNIQLIDASANSLLSTDSYIFEPGKYYSLFAVGANGNYKNVIVNDNFDSLSAVSGNAFIRYINAIPDSSQATVMVTANENNVINEPASYTDVSDFKEVAPGDIPVKVNSDMGNFSAERTITLEKDKIYTILLMGIPAETDTTKSVQIKYIQNGTVTP